MNHAAIPKWDSQGVLPPCDPVTPTSTTRSPYVVSLTDCILRFGTSPERNKILSGFLEFRASLHTAGLDKGFQWIDGSFIENIEIIENRKPNDIDVVTFCHLPTGQTQININKAHPGLFDRLQTKSNFNVDAFFIQLNDQKPELLVQYSAYWYSVWSHRRNQQWKGYLQIDLDSTEDRAAKANLDELMMRGCQNEHQ